MTNSGEWAFAYGVGNDGQKFCWKVGRGQCPGKFRPFIFFKLMNRNQDFRLYETV